MPRGPSPATRDAPPAAAAPGPADCEREPIHAPGAIQPHGALLAATSDGGLVTHASANLTTFLGLAAEDALGRPLAAVLGEAACRGLRDGGLPDRVQLLERPGCAPLRLQAHLSGPHLVVDIEPARGEAWPEPAINVAQSAIAGFAAARTPLDLCRRTVAALRAISGYDRVMAYRFAADGHGEVVAEALAAGLEPFLGLRYPASDIPAQARRLFLAQRVGAVADAAYVPVALLAGPAQGAAALDLTPSALRSVSPMHRHYMRNMGTAASLTVGLASEGRLWGLLVCHHGTPRIASPALRAVAGMIGTVVSLLLAALGEAEVRDQRQARRAMLRAVVDRLAAPLPLAEALAAGGPDLLALVGAEGALVAIGAETRAVGRTPPPAAAEAALTLLRRAARGRMLAQDDLGLRHGELAPCTEAGSGTLLLPITPDSEDAILWFRPELAQSVAWGGDPTLHGPSPRSSFAAWRQTVRGRSAPWAEVDLALAQELRAAIETELAHRDALELAELRRIERLADEPGRRRDLERSNAALEEFAYAASHDLKAPLRAIGHLADWIAEDVATVASADTNRNLALLKGRVERLQRLLDGLLAYSRVGRQELAPAEPVEIAALVRDILATLAPPPGFTVTCADDLPPLRAQRVPLQVVLANLIGNAVKHHDRTEGRIEIGMTLGDGMAEFSVADDGPGIAPRFHERVFAVFQTLVSRDRVDSSGIGLAIVRKHVELAGGRIHIESAPPARGCRFVFTWREAAP